MSRKIQLTWVRTIPAKYKKLDVIVLVFLSDTDAGGNEVVTLQSIVKDHFLTEKIMFSTRESAAGFIDTFTEGQATAFVLREGRSVVGFQRKRKTLAEQLEVAVQTGKLTKSTAKGEKALH